ncbi:unnamed protein product [Phytophthora fragariaefolia]|uniref:Unnamed protein product n=1 Tax=Phytophthora fragariaefolia TaxID=1490495 RepID=A0A9W7CZ28_9STRA|nr:unnamed protein product [Phytophthora fragariaefolia]
MSSTKAQDVAEVFEEYVFRRFGAPTMIRHDRDPRFMSETFKAFAELIQARSRATLSYRPQANGQQERSVKSIVRTVNVYVEDPLQQDRDDIAEKMAHAINNSMDTTRKETPFYLVHGWDAQSTLKAMTSTLRLGDGSLTDAAAWRREANRQHEVALAMAEQYQATEKARRAKEHNEALGRLERMTVPVDERSNPTEVGDLTSYPTYRPLFEPGSRVWLFMERVKPGLTKKLAHRWHGPFLHVSRLKPVRGDNGRPTAELVDGLSEDDRFDFDEELLSEDSWEPGAGDDEYVVEVILDDRWPISTGTGETSANSTSNGGATKTQLGNQNRIYRAEDCYLTISSSASASTVSRWFRLLKKVSNHARHPSVMGTGHRAWAKATPETGVIRVAVRRGKPPQTPRLVIVDADGLGDPISRPREPWEVHLRAERDRRVETDLRVDQGSWKAVDLVIPRSHHSVAENLDSQAQEVRPLLPPEQVVLQGFPQRRELVVDPAGALADQESLDEPHIYAGLDDPCIHSQSVRRMSSWIAPRDLHHS